MGSAAGDVALAPRKAWPDTARSCRDAGTGAVLSAGWKWNMLTGDVRWKTSVFCSCTPASWPSKCGDTPGVSGTTHHGGTRLSLDQESRRRDQSRMVGETRTDFCRPWPCSRSWGCSCMRSSNGRSAGPPATMLANTSPGKKGPTATPTAAVVFALFAPITLVQFAVGNTTSHQVHGIQDYHLLVCEAVGIDPAWYHGVATEQNSRPRTTPP